MYDKLNRTELVTIARMDGNGNVERLAPRKELIGLLSAEPSYVEDCPLEEQRRAMESHIEKNFRRLRTQLPGCTGKCTTFGCPEIVVLRCWNAFEGNIL